MSVTVRVSYKKVQAYLASSPERAAKILSRWKEEGSTETMEQMRILTPVGKTGSLRERITRKLTPKGFSVYPDSPIAQFVEEDTAPHTIFPRTARVLAFEGSSGETIFAAYVKHPGTMGQHFIRRTRDLMRNVLKQLYIAIWREEN